MDVIEELKLQMAGVRSPGSTTFSEFFKKTVQEFLTVVKFETFGFPVIPSIVCCTQPPKSTQEADFQKYFCQQVSSTSKFAKQGCWSANLEFRDTSKYPYLDGRKPDLSFFVKNKPHESANVVLIEIKKEKIDSPEALGEVLTFSQCVLLCAHQRKFCFSFITDCYKIIFLKTSCLGGGKYSYERTHAYNITDIQGSSFLLQMLCAPFHLLGYQVSQFQSELSCYEVSQRLGAGITASVWKANDLAVKHYLPQYQHLRDHEAKILTSLSTLSNPAIPTLVDSGTDFIVIRPVGRPIPRLTRVHLHFMYPQERSFPWNRP